MKPEQIIEFLNLSPLDIEGGFFCETYRSDKMIPVSSLPIVYKSSRSFCTAIYYLLTPDTFSHIHRIHSDEIFHFYLGDPVEMIQLLPDGNGKHVTLGTEIENGMQVQVVVPGGIWQGAKLARGGKYALLGTTVSPGFDYEDYENGQRDILLYNYPGFREYILNLTK